MRKKILLGIGAWLSIVLAVTVGVILGMSIYLVLLYQFSVETTTVETRDVPVEETVVKPIEQAIVVEGVGDSDSIVNVDPGVWLIVGASDLQPIRITSLDHSVGANWNAGREVVVFERDYVVGPSKEPKDYLTFPSGRVRFKKATDGPWTITLHWIPNT